MMSWLRIELVCIHTRYLAYLVFSFRMHTCVFLLQNVRDVLLFSSCMALSMMTLMWDAREDNIFQRRSAFCTIQNKMLSGLWLQFIFDGLPLVHVFHYLSLAFLLTIDRTAVKQ